MSLSPTKARIGAAHRQLLADWERARESWDDSVAQAFGRHLVEPLDRSVRAAIGAIEFMAELTERIGRECGDPTAGR